MNITTPRAFFGLNAKATPAKGGTSGKVQIGDDFETISLTGSTKIISFDAVIARDASILAFEFSDMVETAAVGWTEGEPQTETTTAVGTISIAGTAAVVVTSAGAAWSPKTINVAVANADTAATWAEKVRAALAADADVSSRWDVSGSTTSIVLTRKALVTYNVKGVSIPIYAVTAGSNISIDNGTCNGIVAAPTSTEGAATATEGVYAPDLDGKDFEGELSGGFSFIGAVIVRNSAESGAAALVTRDSTMMADLVVPPGGALCEIRPNAFYDTYDIAITPAIQGGLHCLVTITIAGS